VTRIAPPVSAFLLAVSAALADAPVPTRQVELGYPDAGATSVLVGGDFNGWKPDSCPMERTGTGWRCVVTLTPGRVFEYAFLVDGQWRTDPNNPATARDGRVSVLLVPETPEEAKFLGAAGPSEAYGVLVLKSMSEKQVALNAAVEGMRRDLEERMKKMEDLRREVEVAKAEANGLRMEKANLAKDLQAAQARLTDALAARQDAERARDEAEAKNRALERRNAELSQSLDKTQNALNKALNEGVGRSTEAEQARAEAELARKELEELRRKYEEALADIGEKDAILKATGLMENRVAGKEGGKKSYVERITTVTGVSAEENLVVLDGGKDKGFEVGQRLAVVRDGRLVARIKLDQVGEDWASGEAIEGFDWKDVHEGDSVGKEQE
jgi:uncharacterized protein YoxC